MKQFDKLKAKLAELFQLDQADLDFGIYRIMNARRDEITQFLDRDLLPQVREAFSRYKPSDKAEIQKELDKVIESIKAAGMDPDQSPKVKDLRARLADDAVDLTALENEVYSRLYDFFNRYYDEGDFISLRRYKEGVYAIPYEGEEVKLHWANSDQYYIKTTENFRDYAFKTADGHRVHFKIVEADTEKDNIKAASGNDRRFILRNEDSVAVEGGELVIRFEYRPDSDKRKQDGINADAIQQVIESLNAEELAAWQHRLSVNWTRADGTASDRTILEKHLSDYTKRNTFDYFIHKDLGGFLRRELDFYIKNEVMHLDDVENESVPRVEQYLSKIKVIRSITHKIIDFLAQIEGFQKKLWLKKKFVTDTNYCITLDRVPEEFYPEIAANDTQREEWVRLFAIDEIKQDLAGAVDYSEPLTVEFLKATPFLLLDTQFFSQGFMDRLLASIDDIDTKCDGLLVRSDNYHALSLFQSRYEGEAKCIYIDPPYNTDSAPILYKNDYRHSSWASLIRDRAVLAQKLLTRDGVKIVAIDDTELPNLSKILEDTYQNYRLSRVTVVHNPKGSITKDFNRVHEYALFLTPETTKGCIARTLVKNETPRKMRRWGENSLRTDRRPSFYPIYVKDGNITRVGEVPEDSFHPEGRNVILPSDETEVWPIDQDGVERRWNFGLDSIHNNLDRVTIREVDGTLDLFVTHELTVPKTVWTGGEFDAGNYGNTLLIGILGSKEFSFPKSINTVTECVSLATKNPSGGLVLDYFAGSGTTGHAVISLNRQDEGKRQYILVEMGNYFDTVTKPRIQKVIYSKDWKDGKPVSREGVSHMFKYIRLESYEDALANIQLKRTDAQQSLLDGADSFRESYMLGYILDTEAQGSASLLDIDGFEDPFGYKLLVGTGSVGETKPVNVDLVETFNWLLGLRVRHMDHIRGVRVVEGENPNDEKVLVIWRNLKETTNEDLEDFFRKQQYNTLDMEFDLVYVNGDNNLMNIPVVPEEEGADPTYKVRLIEEEFKRLMFDVRDV